MRESCVLGGSLRDGVEGVGCVCVCVCVWCVWGGGVAGKNVWVLQGAMGSHR